MGCGQYVSAFEINAIDAEMLPKLTSDDLKEIGVAALAHRKKILEAIAGLDDGQGASRLRREADLTAVPPRHPPLSARPREAERRQLTVMFVDLVGSTGFSTHLVLRKWARCCVSSKMPWWATSSALTATWRS
ncbi:hypothetical protein AJ87_47760 [Rhizobium yanglingense]|nr:hypothetical protein AJ87_47760 [Rhizobium yanglingense]